MTPVSKFLRLDSAERRLLIRCACVLAAIRVGLYVVSIRRLHPLVTGWAGKATLPPAGRHSAERIAWAVRAAARYVPGATCLSQALAAEVMLTRYGHPARLCIGLATAEDRTLAGHAWIESAGAIIIGGADVTRYTPVPVLGADPATAPRRRE